MVVHTTSSTDNILIDRSSTAYVSKKTNLSLVKTSTVVQTIVGILLSVIVISVIVILIVFFSVHYTASAPKLYPDSVSVMKRAAIMINVLENDEKPDQLKVYKVSAPRYGTVRIAQDGTAVEYKSNARYAGADSFEYTAGTAYKTRTSYVNVTVLNTSPTPIDFTFQVPRNSKDNHYNLFELKSRGKMISDEDGDIMAIVYASQPSNGSTSFTNSTVDYTPNFGFNGIDSIFYNVTDFNDTSSASINFVLVNTPPVARPDVFTVPKNRMTELNILSNDYDLNYDKLSILNTSGSRARVQVLSDQNSVLYVASVNPAPYVDSFEYLITDGYEGYASSSVVITVENAPPVTTNTSTSIIQNSSNNKISIKYSDFDQMDEHSAKIIDGPYFGTAEILVTRKEVELSYDNALYLVIHNEFTILYTPNHNFLGDDQIRYQITDGYDNCEGYANIHMLVLPPVAQPDSAICQKNLYIDIDVLANDSDPSVYPIVISRPATNITIQSVRGGQIKKMSNRVLRYYAPATFTGSDSFQYSITNVPSDPSRATSSTAQVTVTVVNTPPTANDDSIKMNRNGTADIDVLSNDFDANGDAIQLLSVEAAPDDHRSAIIIRNNTQFVRIHAGQTLKPFVLNYTIADIPDGATATGNVYVSFVNVPPITNNDNVTTLWNRSVVVDVVANDYDDNYDDRMKLAIYDVTQARQGRVEIYNKTCARYIPNPGFIGNDSFTYRITDSLDFSNVSVVYVQVINHAPIASDDYLSSHWRVSLLQINALNNDTDPDGDYITINEIHQPAHGNASIYRGVVRYSVPPRVGLEVIQYSITDFAAFSAAQITINITNTSPVAEDDFLEIHWSFKSIAIQVLENDYDSNNDPLYITNITQPRGGNTSITDQKNFIRFVCDDCFGLYNISYTISDTLDQSSAVLSINVSNDHKVSALELVSRLHWRELLQAPATFQVWNTTVDGDGDFISIDFLDTITQPIIGVNQEEGSTIITVTGTEFWRVGQLAFEYVISDGLHIDDQKGSITLISTNEPPIAKEYNVTLEWDQLLQGIEFDVLMDSHDDDVLDKENLFIVSVEPAVGIETGEGVIEIRDLNTTYLNQTIYYQPAQNETGTFTFVYTISDGLNTSSASISITILPTLITTNELFYTYHWKRAESGVDIDLIKGLNQSVIIQEQQLMSSNNGTARVSNSTLHYQSMKGFLGEDQVIIQVLTPTPTPITIHIKVTNSPPRCPSRTIQLHWRMLSNAMDIPLLWGVSDSDNDTPIMLVSVVKLSGTIGNGTIRGNSMKYTSPFFGFVGKESFQYTVSDGISQSSSQVSISVTNKKPILFSKSFREHFAEFGSGKNKTLNIFTGGDASVSNNDYDPNGDPLMLTYAESMSEELKVDIVNNSTGTVRVFINSNDTSKLFIFKYRASDGSISGTSEQFIQISLINTPPTAVQDLIAVHWKDHPKEIDVLANDYDKDNDTIILLSAFSQNGGIVSVSNNSLLYSPSRMFLGMDRISYTISDGASIDKGTVEVEVYDNPPNAPLFIYHNHWRNVSYESGIEFNILDDPRVVDVDPLDTVSLTPTYSGDVEGIIRFIDGKTLVYSPPNPSLGSTRFNYVVSDGILSSDGTIVINITNTPPTASNRTIMLEKLSGMMNYTLDRNNTLLFNGTTDADGDSLSLIILSGGTKSEGSNDVSFVLGDALSRTHYINYKYHDGIQDSNIAIATILFKNRLPVCKNVTFTMNKGESLNISSIVLCSDEDGDNIQFLPTASNITGFVSINPSYLVYASLLEQSYNYTLEYRVTDNENSTEIVGGFITFIIQNRSPSSDDYTWMIRARRDLQTYNIDYISASSATDEDAYDRYGLFIKDVKSIDCPTDATLSILNNRLLLLKRSFTFYGQCQVAVTISDLDVTQPKEVTSTLTIIVSDPGAIVANDLTIEVVDADQFFYLTEAEIMANDYDKQGGSLIFDGFLYNPTVCSEYGFCREEAKPAQENDRRWRFTQKSYQCQTDRFKYRVVSAQDPSLDAFATVNVVYKNCTCQTPLDIMIVIDSSGSIGTYNFDLMKQFVTSIIDQFDVGPGEKQVQIGVVRFASDAHLIQQLSNVTDQIKTSISTMDYVSGGTSMLAGISLAEQELSQKSRFNVSKVILLLTDGVPNGPCTPLQCISYYNGTEGNCNSPRYPHRDSNSCHVRNPLSCMPCSDVIPLSTKLNSRRLDDQGNFPPEGFWRIIPVGIGEALRNKQAEDYIRQMAADPSQFLVVDWSELNTIVEVIGAQACNFVSLSTKSNDTITVVEEDVPPTHTCGQIVTIGVRNNEGTYAFVNQDDSRLMNRGMYTPNDVNSRNTLYQITNCGSYGDPLTYGNTSISLWSLQTRQYVSATNGRLYANAASVSSNEIFQVLSQIGAPEHKPVYLYNSVCFKNTGSGKYILPDDYNVDSSGDDCDQLNSLMWMNEIKYSQIQYRQDLLSPDQFPTPIINE